MRIGIEAFKIFRKFKHGMDFVAIEHIRQLQQSDRDNEYFIFCFEDEENEVIHETANFHIIKIKKVLLPIAEQIILPYLTVKYQLDVLHSTGNTAPLLTTCKLILTLHDVIYLEKNVPKGGTLFQQLGNYYRRMIVPYAVKKADKIITVSTSEATTIARRLPTCKDKITVIPNACGSQFAVKPLESLLSTQVRYKLPTNGFIFFLANTDPKKNTLNVLKAIHQLKQEGKLTMKVVMADIASHRVNRLIQKYGLEGIEEDLIISNYISNTELTDVYNLASCFLYPSLRESFGIPILEAMACGTPVITSGVSSMPEIAGNAAYYTNPNHPSEIAEAIHQLISNKELSQQFIAKGLIRINRFSWKRSSALLLNVYKSYAKIKDTSSAFQIQEV